MNEQIELVEKWLDDPNSVTSAELFANYLEARSFFLHDQTTSTAYDILDIVTVAYEIASEREALAGEIEKLEKKG